MFFVFVGIILFGKICLKQLKDMAMPVEQVARPFARASNKENSIVRNLFPEEVEAKQVYEFFEDQQIEFDKAPEPAGSFSHEVFLGSEPAGSFSHAVFLGLEQKPLHGGSSSLLDGSQVEQQEVTRWYLRTF